jgi:hypothetical protein
VRQRHLAVATALVSLVALVTGGAGAYGQATDYEVDYGSEVDDGASLRRRVAEVETVVVAKSVGWSMRVGPLMGESGRLRAIVTDFQFEATEVLKMGNASFTVAIWGGKSVGGVPMPTRPPVFVDGREYLLLLCWSPGNGAFVLTHSESSAFDVTDAVVVPLGHSESAKAQANLETAEFLERVRRFAKQPSAKPGLGYACHSGVE